MVWNNTELLYFSSRSQKSKVGQQVAFWGFQGRTCFLVSSSFQRPPAFLDLQPLPLSSHHSKLCLLLLLSLFSRVRLCATLWTVAHQAPLSMGFARQEYWSGLSCPSPGDLPNPGIEPTSLISPALAGTFFTTSAPWEALTISYFKKWQHLPRTYYDLGIALCPQHALTYLRIVPLL